MRLKFFLAEEKHKYQFAKYLLAIRVIQVPVRVNCLPIKGHDQTQLTFQAKFRSPKISTCLTRL